MDPEDQTSELALAAFELSLVTVQALRKRGLLSPRHRRECGDTLNRLAAALGPAADTSKRRGTLAHLKRAARRLRAGQSPAKRRSYR